MKVKRAAREKMLRKALKANGISLKWDNWKDHQKFGEVVAFAAGMWSKEKPVAADNHRDEDVVDVADVIAATPVPEAAWGVDAHDAIAAMEDPRDVDPREDEMMGTTDPADD